MMKNAIYFAIDDNYAFAAANMLMGLHQYCGELLKTCDIILYHNGLSEKNAQLLAQLHPGILLEPISFPDSWKEMTARNNVQKYNGMILCKFFGFRLIQTYDYALFLDADMLIRGDLSALFTLDTEMAWRKVIAWEPKKVFSPLLNKHNEDITAGNAGLLLYTSKLRKYAVDDVTIIDAFRKIQDLGNGGIDELVLAWIAYSNGMRVTELDMDVYNTPAYKALDNTRLLHFLYWRKTTTKPWDNLAAYLYFDDWAENYQKWLALGGDGPVHYTKEDYYNLFAFEKSGEIMKKDKQIAKLEKRIETIIGSRGWKMVQFLRRIKDKLRKLLKCFKK